MEDRHAALHLWPCCSIEERIRQKEKFDDEQFLLKRDRSDAKAKASLSGGLGIFFSKPCAPYLFSRR